MGMCSDPPAPPDLQPQADAMMQYSEDMRAVADDQLAWSKEEYANNKEILNRVLNTQLPIMEQNAQNAQEDRAFYERQYRPLETSLIEEFQSYDSPERREKEAGEAIADVTTGFEAQRENASRRLESYGIDPSQTRSQALDAGVRIAEASAQAGGANVARRRVEATGRALRGEALNIGKGYAGNVAGAYATAINAGNSGISNANQTFGTGSNAMNAAAGNYGRVAQGISGSANITNSAYQNELAAYDSGNAMMNAIVGGAAGAATSMIAEGGEIVVEENTIRQNNSQSADAASLGFAAGMKAGEAGKKWKTRRAIGSDLDREMEDPTLFANGGEVRGPGTGVSDSVPAAIQAPSGAAPAALSDGEYVIPADVVRWKGLEHIEKMITSSKEGMSSRQVQSPDGGRTGVIPPPQVDIDRSRPAVALPPPQGVNPRRVGGY